MKSHVLSVRELTKEFKTAEGPIRAVDGVSFEILGDEFFTMLGPSGCGKTTTLRMIAGLEAVTSGAIAFDGRDLARVSASDRGIGMVFQSYALFPHLSVFENAAYGLRTRGIANDALTPKVQHILSLLGLDSLASRYPSDLSGGQQQRVSIARALAYDPDMLLLDEPLANLDAKLRVEMREEIRRIQKELGILTMYVTHDQEEAMSVSDRVAVFDSGRIAQMGRPQEVYDKPTSLFVADFIGKANLYPAKVVRSAGEGVVVALKNGHEAGIDSVVMLPAAESETLDAQFDGILMLRPEQLRLSAAGDSGLRCRVRRVQFLGGFVRYVVESPEALRDVVVDMPSGTAPFAEGDGAMLTIRDRAAVFYRRGSHA
jgi:ABC-type Fe3+/spermidine/putrescine transport system ATPase subunit